MSDRTTVLVSQETRKRLNRFKANGDYTQEEIINIALDLLQQRRSLGMSLDDLDKELGESIEDAEVVRKDGNIVVVVPT